MSRRTFSVDSLMASVASSPIARSWRPRDLAQFDPLPNLQIEECAKRLL